MRRVLETTADSKGGFGQPRISRILLSSVLDDFIIILAFWQIVTGAYVVSDRGHEGRRWTESEARHGSGYAVTPTE